MVKPTRPMLVSKGGRMLRPRSIPLPECQHEISRAPGQHDLLGLFDGGTILDIGIEEM